MMTATPNGVRVFLYVQPNASKSELVGEYNRQLKVKIKAPPIDGKANEAIIEFFSEALEVPRKNLEILRGGKSRGKILLIRGLTIQGVNSKLSL